ncbi:hypothetical protein K505DRAFT_359937 [Melanomma pulvis-pyrius CBS 109.77]|uniref:Uncharacterized protein n=1 Tax=Melanomma pulvis-pyrius CBS 109.77 TaxID=1314802 RepID=A0A6A6XHS2_9PLEO|nr:hypothetical protein K505DRAFT_359937 [Melanomma pulvis-pyrius CBS 109.77]
MSFDDREMRRAVHTSHKPHSRPAFHFTNNLMKTPANEANIATGDDLGDWKSARIDLSREHGALNETVTNRILMHALRDVYPPPISTAGIWARGLRQTRADVVGHYRSDDEVEGDDMEDNLRAIRRFQRERMSAIMEANIDPSDQYHAPTTDTPKRHSQEPSKVVPISDACGHPRLRSSVIKPSRELQNGADYPLWSSIETAIMCIDKYGLDAWEIFLVHRKLYDKENATLARRGVPVDLLYVKGKVRALYDFGS